MAGSGEPRRNSGCAGVRDVRKALVPSPALSIHMGKQHKSVRWAVYPAEKIHKRPEYTPPTPHTPPDDIPSGECGECGECVPVEAAAVPHAPSGFCSDSPMDRQDGWMGGYHWPYGKGY